MSDTTTKTALRLARENAGLGREEVTRLLDPPISAKTLERWEERGRPSKPYWLVRLADIYGVTPKDLAAEA